MIISASRRTDIPAFYTKWFLNRIKAGYCAVPNPFNRNRVSYVSLKPDELDVIVFWTRNPAPLIPFLRELDDQGFRYYFQFTVLDNPGKIDQKSPPFSTSVKTFKKLSDMIGPERVIWRYDPIVISQLTGVQFHIDHYEKIAKELQGYSHRSVISVVDFYKKASRRFTELHKQGIDIIDYQGQSSERFDFLMEQLVHSATSHKFETFSCSEVLDLTKYGVNRGKCVDDDYIHQVFNVPVNRKKDPNQRAECGCVISKDIGMYDSCLFGCQYCYATSSFERARINHDQHDANSPSLIGWYEAEIPLENSQGNLFDLKEKS
jgi:hypothetical protein